ncbi:glycoside hydrolase superfamily [Sporodiniella umbellata]|nr:glycoside hydrolase superfamily [Sporodiniella umbellata]
MTKTKLGQLLMCGFDGFEPTEGILDLIRHQHLGSVILFSRNIDSPEQVQRMIHTLQTTAYEAGHERPLWIAVDQENGVVRRLGKSATYFPGSMALGAIGCSQEAEEVAKSTAKELLTLGIQWNLAPVLDVNSNPLNPVIGVRSFGEDPDQVAQLGKAQVTGYQSQGVAACVKHFPGHGDTATDSHLGVPVVDKAIDIELKPFRQTLACAESYPASVMVAHIALPQLIASGRVASLSSEIVQDLLREQLHYKGVIITDCLEMDAVRKTVGSAPGAVLALEAGNDMVMLCHTLEYQQEAIRLIEQMDVGKLQASLERVAAMKDRYLNWKDTLTVQSLNGFGSHSEQSQRLYEKVPTLVRDVQRLIPLRPEPTDRVLFLASHVPLTLAIDSEPEPFNSFYHSLRRRLPQTDYVVFDAESYASLVPKIKAADYVIVGTANANLYAFQSELVHLAHQHARRLVVAAVINPYDLTVFPEISTYLVAYEYTPPAHEALVRLMLGEIAYRANRLPITLPTLAEPYNPQDLAGAYTLWSRVFCDWPLSLTGFEQVLSQLDGPHWIVRDQGKIVGLGCTQRDNQLALLMVDPAYRRRGIGGLLHTQCEKSLTHPTVVVGATYPRFFCGVPEDQPEALAFFQRLGYQCKGKVWDLMGDMSEYQIPQAIEARMREEGIEFSLIGEDGEALLRFQEKYFSFWLATYQHHLALGDTQDLLVARDRQGEIVASLVLYTAEGSHPARTDLIWREAALFGPKSGAMACVGVADHVRGKGIGLGIVAHANKILRERGVNKVCVDWVEAVDFYRRTGYQTWRGYNLVAKSKK